MTTVDLILMNCKLVTPSGIKEAGLAVDQEKIVSIAKDPLLPKADKVIDVKGNIVIPGGIDAHVHFMDPGYTFREDWETGSGSAAAGGVSLVIDHGLTNPPSTNVENLGKIKAEAEMKSVVDYGLNGAVVPSNLRMLPELGNAGVTAFGEIFMAESVPELESVDDGVLLEAFQIIRKIDGVAGVHAENCEIVSRLASRLRGEGRNDPSAHVESRPNIAEAEAVSRALLLAKYTGVRLHIFHLSTKEGIELVRNAKEAGQSVSTETCPHYLLFTKESMAKYGPYLKYNPPLRSKGDVEALWEALRRGDIDMVSTDHWPLQKSEKEKGWENIWEVDAGGPGVETRIPLLLTFGVRKGRISLEKFVEITSENPAKAFRLYPMKGAIRVGSDADLTIIDLKKRMVIRATEMHTKANFTPFEGWEVQGVPITTLVRGQVVMQEGEILAKPGYGRFVRPKRSRNP